MAETPDKRLDAWVEEILRGDARAVARAISAVENRESPSRELLQRLFPHTGRARIIGVTGSPGTGKSTLVDGLAALLRRRGHTVGILAVDPSSPFSGGAILGDRVRMQTHAADPGTYIRSMATRGALGGLAAGTLDAAVVLDAAGKDYILVETVGVGQDEIDVMRMADLTLVLLVPGLGDDVQAFKAGIMEIADIFVLNKSDIEGADRVEAEVRGLLSLAAGNNRDPASVPPICRTVAVRQEGLEDLLATVLAHLDASQDREKDGQKKVARWRQRLADLLRERMLERVMIDVMRSGGLDQYAAAVAARERDPYSVAEEILDRAAHHEETVSGTAADVGGTAILDHLAVAVESLADAARFYERALGLTVTGCEVIEKEKTRVAMAQVGQSRIELMEATEPDSPVAGFLAKRGPGLHHISLRVPDLDRAISRLQQNGIKIINAEPGIGAGGHRYVFVHPSSTGGVLLELVEQQHKSDPRA